MSVLAAFGPKRTGFLLTCFTFLTGTLFAQTTVLPDGNPAPPPGKAWELVWHDEFEGDTIDWSKWETPPDGPRRDGWWLKDAVSLDGEGHLVIRTYRDGDRYVDGCLRTRGKYEKAFGYFEARIKFQRQPGHWSAFWMWGTNVLGEEDGGRDGTEIDIVEKAWLDDRIQHTLHWDGYAEAHDAEGKVVQVEGVSEGFHTVALWWTPEEYVFYVDGRETWRTRAGGVCQQPLYLKLSDEIGNWGGDITQAQLPDEFQVDYVRVFDLVDATDGGPDGEARSTLIFPQFVNGAAGGFANRSRLVLGNQAEEPIKGMVRFSGDDGLPVSVPIGGRSADSHTFQIEPKGRVELVTDGTGLLQSGAVEVALDEGEPAGLTGTEIYDVLGRHVSVENSPPALAHQAFVTQNERERTALALFNPDREQPVSLDVLLLDKDGREVATASRDLGPGEQRARFVDEAELFGAYFQAHPEPFQGSALVRTRDSRLISVLGLVQQRNQGALLSVAATRLDPDLAYSDCRALVTASSVEGQRIEYQPGRASDGNFLTRWSSGFSNKEWLLLDLGRPREIRGVRVFWETAFAREYAVRVSIDGQSWSTAFETLHGTGGYPEEIQFKTRKARFLRFELEVRASQGGYSVWEIDVLSDDPCRLDWGPEEQIEELVAAMTLEEKTSFVHGETVMNLRGIPRLGIPPLQLADGPLGLRWGESTAFPAGIALSASWDVDLAERFGRAIGREWKNKGRHVWLGPCINIVRVPHGGRNFETYGEDPYLNSRMAAAAVRGAQSEKIIACPKHYAANNQEFERYSIDIQVPERVMREIYLPAFKAAVTEGGAWAIMSAYNQLNGSHCTENTFLQQQVLKEEWGFKGFVVSDWGASHSTVGTALNGLDLEMDGASPIGAYWGAGQLLAAVRSGQVPESVVDDKVRRILSAIFGSGALSVPADAPWKELFDHRHLAREIAESGIVLLKNESNILPLDPMKAQTIALIGPNLLEARTGGGGSSRVDPYRTVSPAEAIREIVGDQVTLLEEPGTLLSGEILPVIDPSYLLRPDGPGNGLRGQYYNNIDLSGTPVLTRIDANVDFNWWSGSPGPGVNADRFSVRWYGGLQVPESGDYLIGMVSDDGFHLYINGRRILSDWTDHAARPASTEIYLEGGRRYGIEIRYYENGGDAVARLTLARKMRLEEAVTVAAASDVAVLFVGLSAELEGEGWDRASMELDEGQQELISAVAAVNPRTIVVVVAGSQVGMGSWVDQVLSVVQAWYPGQEGGYAIADILFGKANPSGRLPMTFVRDWADHPAYQNYPGGTYTEGLYVGYRHFDSRGVEPLFPFGHGLSYTSYEYSDLELDTSRLGSEGVVSVSLRVANTGTRAGGEVVQLYVRDTESTVDRPFKELKRFAKVRLAPGEDTAVSFELDLQAFSYWDEGTKDWRAEPGEFEILLGSSSRDIRLQGSLVLPDFELPGRSGADLVFPQFADGQFGGVANSSRVVLRNRSSMAGAGSVRFQGPDGIAVEVSQGGEERSVVPFEVSPLGTTEVRTDGEGQLKSGVVEVRAGSKLGSSLDGTEIFEILGSFVSVGHSPPSGVHSVYVSVDAVERTAVALYNPDRIESVRLTCILLNAEGSSVATLEKELDPGQQIARFIDDDDWFGAVLPGATGRFRGSLEIAVEGGGTVSALGLLQQRKDGALIAVSSERQ